MGRYFGREPRLSREEIERQAQEAIDARVSLGRPPAEDWRPLEQRLAEIDQALAARPPAEPLPEPQSQPLRITEIRMSGTASAPAAAQKSAKQRSPKTQAAKSQSAKTRTAKPQSAKTLSAKTQSAKTKSARRPVAARSSGD